jgi:hypothetical protein
MTSLKSFCALGFAAVLATSLVALWPGPASAQEDRFVGTWVLNVAKSKYSPGPLPKSQTVVYEAAGNGLKVTSKADVGGKPMTTTYTASYDGKDVAVTGNPDYDMTSVKRIDGNNLELTRKRAGKVVQTVTMVLSKDGKTRTVTTTGVNAQGQKVNNVAVFEKK